MDITGLEQPFDVVVVNELIFVVMNDCIKAFDWRSGDQKKTKRIHGLKPFAIATDGDKLYVTDKVTNSVVVFDQMLQELRRFRDDRLAGPKGIEICRERRMMMVLNENSRSITTFCLNGNSTSTGPNMFEEPWHIRCNNLNQVVVTDAGAKMVKIFDLNNFTRVADAIHTTLDGVGMHCRGLDVDKHNHKYVALRAPGFRSQRECIAKYNEYGALIHQYLDSPPASSRAKNFFSYLPMVGNGFDSIVEDATGGGGKTGDTMDFVRGIRYHERGAGNSYLFIVDAGNRRVRVTSLESS